METLSPVSLCRHVRMPLTSRHPTQFIDVTDRVQGFIADAGVRVGVVNVQTLHTTSGIVVNEHEPLLLEDFQSLLEKAAPCDGQPACFSSSRSEARTEGSSSTMRIIHLRGGNATRGGGGSGLPP